METEALQSIQYCLVAMKKMASLTHVDLRFASFKKFTKIWHAQLCSMIKPNPKNGTGSKLEPVLRIWYSKMAIPTSYASMATIIWLSL